MFTFDDDAERFAQQCFEYVTARLRDGAPLRVPPTPAEMAALIGNPINSTGMGTNAALALFRDVVAPAAIPLDSWRHCALIPGAPSITSTLFDACVSAAALVPEAWLEAAGAVHAENQALRWIADLAGMPETAGGCFVSGGTAGNLNALTTARDAHGRGRHRVACSTEAHSSVEKALRLLALDTVLIPTDDHGRLVGAQLAKSLAENGDDVFAVVSAAGNTNAGTIDDLDGIARVCRERDLWLHVDGAYGAGALCAPSVREHFAGIEHADSLIVDPHKWLFAPLDCCALLYREPERARLIHQQSAGYLDALWNADGSLPSTPTEGDDRSHPDSNRWNPADYALHLTRRARGLPFWFALVAHGTDAFRDAIESTLATTRVAAQRITESEHLELIIEPTLSVLLFRRAGWGEDEYLGWARDLLERGVAFVLPTKWRGESVGRFVFLHPNTTIDLFDEVMAATR